MRFNETDIDGLWIIEPDRLVDDRGSFARTFCRDEFLKRGLEAEFVQHSQSTSALKHTLRGLHYQEEPYGEVKVVSCPRGAIFDVAVDLRPGSPTFMQWRSARLTAENGAQFYIPKGFAHGFQALTDDVAVQYMMTTVYVAASSKGVRYDDPAFGIQWPQKPSVISDRDRSWPLMSDRLDLAASEI